MHARKKPELSLYIEVMGFCLQIVTAEDLDNDIEEVLHSFEEKCQRPILHSIVFN